MAIMGILNYGDHAVVTSMEHNSVLRPVHKTCDYTVVYADRQGRVEPTDIENAINENTKLVVVTHASNVSGTVMPVEEIGKICKRHNIPLLLDCAQTAGIIPIDVLKMNVSLLAFSGHKGLMGPLGTGGLYVREGIDLSPVIVGGTGTFSKELTQPVDFPDMLHSGTLNTPAIMTLSTAVRFLKGVGIENILAHERGLATRLCSELNNIKGVRVYGPLEENRNGTVAFNIYGLDSQVVADMLSRGYNIAVRGGYHCAYLAHKTLGSEASGAVRAGFGFYSTRKELDKLVDAVNRIAKNPHNI
jgi:cysteine desulfurase family protein